MKKVCFFGILVILLISCKKQGENILIRQIKDDFETGKDGWIAGYADYSPVTDPLIFEFDTTISNLPAPLNTERKGYRIVGHNRSDDLFMFLKKKVTNLTPNKSYKLHFLLEIGSDAPSNAIGAGGAPGEGVTVKIGVTKNEPAVIYNLTANYLVMTIDKGNQINSGNDMRAIGNIANGLSVQQYKIISREGDFIASTDEFGNLWLIIGTDSGFEGKTTLYYDKISVSINLIK